MNLSGINKTLFNHKESVCSIYFMTLTCEILYKFIFFLNIKPSLFAKKIKQTYFGEKMEEAGSRLTQDISH